MYGELQELKNGTSMTFFISSKKIYKHFKCNHIHFFQFFDFSRGASSLQELQEQVVTENLSTLYLTRLIGFPAISTDPPHAFILSIQWHRALNSLKYGKRDRFSVFCRKLRWGKSLSISQSQPRCRNQTHRKLESYTKYLQLRQLCQSAKLLWMELY